MIQDFMTLENGPALQQFVGGALLFTILFFVLYPTRIFVAFVASMTRPTNFKV